MDREAAIKKVQKLMAVAQDNRGNENEAERALAQAETMMRKFGIEQSEVASSAAAPDFDWTNAFAPYGVPRQPAKSCPMWYQFIATGVATFTDTIVRLHYDSEKGYGVGFYGDRSDVLFAQWLITYLRDNVWKEAKKAVKMYGWGRVEAEDFRKAMASRLSSRMRQLRKERDAEFAAATNSAGVTGTALVIVNNKLAKRDEEFGPQTYGKAQQHQSRSYEATIAGRNAGDRVGFSRPLAGSTQRAQIGA